jgi:hypothetical protein
VLIRDEDSSFKSKMGVMPNENNLTIISGESEIGNI